MFSLFWKCQCWLFPQMFGGNCCWLVQANVHFLIWLIKIKESIWKPFKGPSTFGVFFVPVVYGKLSPTWGIQSELRSRKIGRSVQRICPRGKRLHIVVLLHLLRSLLIPLVQHWQHNLWWQRKCWRWQHVLCYSGTRSGQNLAHRKKKCFLSNLDVPKAFTRSSHWNGHF